MQLLFLGFALVCCSLPAIAQVVPFSTTGFLDSATSTGTSVRSGGQISVNGFSIVIPDNLLVEFPALHVPFKEFTEGNRAGPNEVSITGNIVNDKIIAGQMSIAQLSLQSSNGYIESLGTDGAIKIKNGPTIRINDPNAAYSAGYTKIPFFTADDENPSITSFGGFPMCVPRSSSDPKCPQSNRPTNVPNPLNYIVPDPDHMAPMKVGDYLEYSGIKDGGEIICYSIVVNIGIYTTPGTAPGFILVEDANIGVINNNPDVEFARARFVGFVTDPSTNVEIYAIDQDPCTGEEIDRLIGSATPEPGVGGRAKWEFRTDRNPIGLYTRNYRIKLASGTHTTSDGILAGQYVQPVTEWIFPEVITPGATPPPLDFTEIGPLANGFGPDADGNVFHQLNPWPGAAAPTPSKQCPDTVTPTTGGGTTDPVNLVADAGANQIVRGGTIVTLKATQTNSEVAAADLGFAWNQTSGPTTGVTITDSTKAVASFNAPVLGSTDPATVSRNFTVTITHVPSGSTAKATVIIVSNKTAKDHPIVDTFSWVSRQSGTVTATAHTELIDPAATMQIRIGTGGRQPMSKTGPGKWSYTARDTPQPSSITVQSFIGSVAVSDPVVKTGPSLRKRRRSAPE